MSDVKTVVQLVRNALAGFGKEPPADYDYLLKTHTIVPVQVTIKGPGEPVHYYVKAYERLDPSKMSERSEETLPVPWYELKDAFQEAYGPSFVFDAQSIATGDGKTASRRFQATTLDEFWAARAVALKECIAEIHVVKPKATKITAMAQCSTYRRTVGGPEWLTSLTVDYRVMESFNSEQNKEKSDVPVTEEDEIADLVARRAMGELEVVLRPADDLIVFSYAAKDRPETWSVQGPTFRRWCVQNGLSRFHFGK